MKLCFIGAGRHAKANILPAAQAAGHEIQAICTRHLESAKEACRQFGALGGPYTDYNRMLQSEPCDGVVIVAQPQDALALTKACITHGKPVFVDKPLGWTEEQAQEVAELAETSGVPVMVGFMKRYAPCYRQVKDTLLQKTIGDASSFTILFGADTAKFCPSAEDYIKLAAIHMIDVCRFLFGEVETVVGMQKGDAALSISATLAFQSGVLGNLYFCGMDAWSREQEELVVTCEHGFIKTENLQSVQLHKSGIQGDGIGLTEEDRILTATNSPATGTLRDLYLRGFAGEMEAFAGLIRGGKTVSSTAQDNVQTMRLCEQLLAAIQK